MAQGSQPLVAGEMTSAAPAGAEARQGKRGIMGIAQRLTESPLLPPALLIVFALALYARSLSGSFVFDDEYQIVENPFITNPHLWRHIFTGSVWSFQGAGAFANFYRPLMIFSFWVIYRLAGAQPFYFHALQVTLFAAAAVLVYLVAKELTGSKAAGLIAGLLWVAHPQKAEPVAWISALNDTGCGLFYLVAFLLFLRGERAQPRDTAAARTSHSTWFYDALGAVALFVALLFKEMAVSFPLLIIAFWFFRGKGRAWKERALRLAPYTAALGVYLGARWLALGHLTRSRGLVNARGRLVYDAVALLGTHTRLFFWPVRLSPFRTVHLTAALHTPWPWLTVAVLVTIVALRKRTRSLGFLVIWWPVTLLPCLDIRQLSGPFVADRMSYLPSAGLCIAIGYLAAKVFKGRVSGRPLVWSRAVVGCGLVTVVAAWCALSVRTSAQWLGNQTLLEQSFAEYPDDPIPHIVRAWDLRYRENNLPAAQRELNEATRLNHLKSSPDPFIDSMVALGLGQIAQQEGHTSEAVALFQKAIRLQPRSHDAYMAMGSIYLPRGGYSEAARYFEKAVVADEYDPSAKFLLGTCWMKVGKPVQAAAIFKAARQLDPTFWAAYRAEASALDAAGKHQEANQVRSLVREK